MAAADFHAVGVTGNQRQGNATVFFVTQQFFRVKQTEGKTHHSGDGRQGDPAFFEVKAQAKHFFAINGLFAHYAGIGQ